MRQAVESARMGWDLYRRGRGRQGETLDIVPRFLITARGSQDRRSAVSRAATASHACRACSPATSTSSRSISHRLTLDEVNRGFELMEAQDGIRSGDRFCDRRARRAPGVDVERVPVADGDGGHGVLVDSNGVEDPLLEQVESRRITITHVLVTLTQTMSWRDRARKTVRTSRSSATL